jgi:hypothetical protein
MEYDLILSILVQVATLGVFGGIIWTKITQLEKADEDLKDEVRDFRELRQDLAVVKSQLTSISVCISRLAEAVDRKYLNEVNIT